MMQGRRWRGRREERISNFRFEWMVHSCCVGLAYGTLRAEVDGFLHDSAKMSAPT